MISLGEPIAEVINHLNSHGIRAILVGGFVRDHLSGHSNNDLDIELYGVTSLEALEALLRPFGKLGVYGKSFGVLRLTYGDYTIDFSPPRTESKSGVGHTGFDMVWYSDLSFEQASRRRDFTINAIGYDPIAQNFLDPYGGIDDLHSKILRCVDRQTFVDDPLRILRAMQFAARFELECDPVLIELCRSMIDNGALQELPKERIFEEFKKLLLQSKRPSIGLELLKAMGGLSFFAPLDELVHTPQDPTTHPEGSVWVHTLMALDMMATFRSGQWRKDMVLMLAILLHDIGKPKTTITVDGIVIAPKHAEIGVELSQRWLEKITEDKALIENILPLIHYHGSPSKLFRSNGSGSDILRLSTHVCIDNLILIASADYFGRDFCGERPIRFEAGEWLYRCAESLGVLYTPPAPLLQGRDLIAVGLTPSAHFTMILNDAFEAQLDQRFSTHDEAVSWLESYLVTKL